MLPVPPEKVALPPRHPLAQIHDDNQAFIQTRAEKESRNAEQEDEVSALVRERRRGTGRAKGGSGGVAALLEPPGVAVRCDITQEQNRK